MSFARETAGAEFHNYTFLCEIYTHACAPVHAHFHALMPLEKKDESGVQRCTKNPHEGGRWGESYLRFRRIAAEKTRCHPLFLALSLGQAYSRGKEAVPFNSRPVLRLCPDKSAYFAEFPSSFHPLLPFPVPFGCFPNVAFLHFHLMAIFSVLVSQFPFRVSIILDKIYLLDKLHICAFSGSIFLNKADLNASKVRN